MEAICFYCHRGVVQSRSGSWARVFGPYLITVPQMEIHVCDACGRVEYDRTKLGQLSAILRSGEGLGQQGHTQLYAERGNPWLKNW